jgi:polysaccharide export outer membrane protein
MDMKLILSVLLASLVCLWRADTLLAKDYRVGPGDVLSVSVYDNDDLATKVRVSSAGTIVMPLLGQLEVKDLTINEITEKITRMLSDGYLVNPQVNVFVEEFRSKKVVVLGSVKTPGSVELNGPSNFLEQSSKSGGLDKDAGPTASLQRQGTGEAKEVIVIDLRALIDRGDLTQNLQINDGDSVFISKSGMCYITGEVKEPGTYPCGEGATVLKLVALAKGFTGKASKSSINIVRLVDNKKTVLDDVDLSATLTNNDVVVVPESFF